MATAFYGISFNVTGFGLNIYLTQFIYAVIEFPAKISVYFLLDKIGRRSTMVGALLLTGVCLGINILVPKGRCSFISSLTSKPLVICCFMRLLSEIKIIFLGLYKFLQQRIYFFVLSNIFSQICWL